MKNLILSKNDNGNLEYLEDDIYTKSDTINLLKQAITAHKGMEGNMETMNMAKTEAIKLINKAYDRLECLNNISWTKYRDELFRQNKEGEKRHQALTPDGITNGLSITEAAKLFTVNWVAEYLTEEKKAPEASEFINMRSEAFYAYSLSVKYKKEILKAWEGLDLKAIASLDYAELMK